MHLFVYSVVHFGWYSVLAHFLYIHPLQNFFHQVTLYQQAILTANGLFWLKTLFWLFGLCSFQVLTCLAWLVWREYLARLASIDASFFVASSEASQRCNSHPPDRQLAHETRASLRVFPLRVVLVSTVDLVETTSKSIIYKQFLKT